MSDASHATNINNNLLHDCISVAIDGFLFRGVTPSDHYYHFSRSFPQACLTDPKLTSTFAQCYNSRRTKSNASFDLFTPDGKLSLTCLSSKLSNARTFLSASDFKGDAFATNSSDLSSLRNEMHKIEERLSRHRVKHNRPTNIDEMSKKEILDEKTNVQQELLRFETKYSKPTHSEQKKIVKPLYDYYRQLKRLVESQQPI